MDAKEMEVSNQTYKVVQTQAQETDDMQDVQGSSAPNMNTKKKRKKRPKCNPPNVKAGNSSGSRSLLNLESSPSLERCDGGGSVLPDGPAALSSSVLPAVDHQGHVPASVVQPTRKEKKGHFNLNDSSQSHQPPLPTPRSTRDPLIPSQIYSRRVTTSVPPSTDNEPSSVGGVPSVINEKRKGRYARKKAKENALQAAGLNQSPSPLNSVENFIRETPSRAPFVGTPPRGTPPKGPANIPAGVQPLNYLRSSVNVRSPQKDKIPKQEKFTPYWPDSEVEAGLKSGALIKGLIRINPRNYQKAYISQDDDEAKDVLIDGIMDRNRGLEGDEVAIKLHEEAKWMIEEGFNGEKVVQKTGMVVAILEKKHNRCTVGFLKLVAKTAKSNTPKRNTRKGEATPRSKTSTPSAQPQCSPQPQSRNSTSKKSGAQILPPSPLAATPPVLEQSRSVLESPSRNEELTTPLSEVQGESEEQILDVPSDEILPELECSTLPSGMPDECLNPNDLNPVEEEQITIPPIEVSDQQVSPSQPAAEEIHDTKSAETPKQSLETKVEQWKMPEMVLFSPRDARMPRMWVCTNNLPSGTPTDLNPSNCQNHLFLANITAWNDQPIAKGMLLAYVGEADEVESETAALLLEHNLDVTPFPENLLKLPPLPFQIPQKELDERLDLRNMCIFTIDPLTAKDLDDALSVRQLDEHNLEIGVHIADPSFFLEEDSELDIFVRNRATSIYLVQQVFHMLPKDLCMLCSLLPGEDKLAFSLMMEIDMKTWTVTHHKFSRSVIRSCAQLAYEHAQAFIDDPDHDWSGENFPMVHNGYTINDLCKAVNMIRPFSAVLRERRFAYGGDEAEDSSTELSGGALRINQPKLYFRLDDATCMPQEVFVYENKESHRLIEELMLTANILTAQRLYSVYPKHAFLRRHRRPKVKMLNNIAQELTHYGIHLTTSSAGALNASLRMYGLGSVENESVNNKDSVLSHGAESNSTLCQLEGNKENKKSTENFLDAQQVASCLETVKEGDSTSRKKTEELPGEACSMPLMSEEVCYESALKTEGIELNEKFETLNLEQSINHGKASDQLMRENDVEVSDNVYVDSESYVRETVIQVHCPESRQSVQEGSKAVKSKKSNADTFCKNFVSSPTSMPASEKALAKARDLVLNHLCAKPMVRADYYCLGASIEKTANKTMTWKLDSREEEEDSDEVYTQHYALNVPLYTHFTSPIRRYADIMVHRLLAASLGYAPAPSSDPLDIQKIASNCNSQNYGAKRASEASNDLFFRLWIRLQVEQGKKNGISPVNIKNQVANGDSEESRSEGGIRETAVVVNAKDYSFDAILIRFGVLVRVYVNVSERDKLVTPMLKLPACVRSYKKHGTSTISILWFLPGKNTASRNSPRQEIAMFSIVDVMIYYSYSLRRIRAELVSPFAALNEPAPNKEDVTS